MLPIVIPARELYNSKTKEFIQIKETALSLEHSLISLSKWEAQYKKPFLSTTQKTVAETIDYIRYMTLNPNVNQNVYEGITDENVRQVSEYIQDPMTATWVNEPEKKGRSQVVTSELIYCWMIMLGIPFSCEKWHLNRLMTLIKVCSAKNKKPQKMSSRDIAARNAALNEQRRKALNSRG